MLSRTPTDCSRRIALRLALLLPAFGCASQASRPVAEFPGRDALGAIAAGPAPTPKLDVGVMPPEGWLVETSAAPEAPAEALWPANAPWQPRGAWDRAVADGIRAAGRSARMTEAMSCVARELGRWVLDHPQAPPAGLRRFIIAACGALAPDVGVKTLGGDVPAEVSEQAIVDRWRGQIGKDLVADLPAAATDAGFAFARKGGRVVAVLSFAQLRAELEPFSLSPGEAGELTLAGTVRDQAEYIGAYVNQGPHGVAPCFVDPTVPRPRFRLTCQVRSEDETAWIELVYAQPRRVLGHTFARVLARRPGARQLRYQPPPARADQTVASPDQFARAAVQALNQVRAAAGLSPVRLHAGESAAATRVARHYFGAALSGGVTEQMDVIALGLLAGWEVGGMIRDGSFASTLVPQTRDPGRWLDETIELPIGRSTLLAEGIEEVALGPVLLDDPPATGALVVGYRFHRSNDHGADIRRLMMSTLVARKHRKLEAPKRLAGMDKVMKAELDRVNQGRAQPMEALQNVLEAGVSRFGAGMQGYVVEASSLDALQIPDEVLRQPTLHMEIGVTHHKPAGAAWAQLVILVVFLDYGNTVPT
jgi:hypothetical protein